MKKTAYFISLLLLTSSCTPDGRMSAQKARQQLLSKQRKQLQGSWKWTSDSSFIFVVSGSRAVYIRNGKTDKDSLEIAFLTDNCNPAARYDTMARRLAKDPFYLHTERITSHAKNNRCFAIIKVSKHHLVLVDTENGTVIEYER